MIIITRNRLVHNNTEAQVLQLFDDDDKASGSPSDIFDIIRLWLKEVQKFCTPRAFKAFMDLTAVIQYVKLHEHYKCNNHFSQPCLSASLAIARCCGKEKGTYLARQIRANENHLLKYGWLPFFKKDVLLGVCKYLVAQTLGSITTKDFWQQTNEVIIPALGYMGKDAIISERTARNWLQKLGYSCVKVRKGLYHDGHEWPDVMEARKMFLEEMAT